MHLLHLAYFFMKYLSKEQKVSVYKVNEYLVLDGYNIINAWSDLKEIAYEDLDGSRQKLIEIMMEYAAFKGVKVIIVFDAYLVKGARESVFEYKNLTVVYTKEHMTADSYIEKFISNAKKNIRIKVASSDGAQQQIVLGKGGSRMSARELQIEIDNTKTKIKRKTEEKNLEKNTLDCILDEETLSKLQKIRRNR